MTIDVRDTIMPLAEEELQSLSRRYPEHGETLRRALEEFRILYEERAFRYIADLTRFCTEVDQLAVMRDMPSDIVIPIRESRRAILARIAQQDLQAHPPKLQDMDPDREIRGPRGQQQETGRQRPRTQEELQELMEKYVSLAAQIGEEEVVQILISLNRLSVTDIPRAIRTLRSYLGHSRGGPGGGGPDIPDPQILQIQSVRRVVNRMILRTVYNTLVGTGGDTMERHEQIRAKAGREAKKIMEDLARKSNVSSRDFRDVFEERRIYFEQAAALHVPDRFVRTIEHEGEPHPLPSWRQRIAVMEAQRQQHIIIGYEPGLGKTFIPIWLHELLAEQREVQEKPRGRMLYLGPKNIMTELPNRIRANTVRGLQSHSYYVSPEVAPTVGVITDGLSAEEVEAQMNAEMVFCPYTMLNVVKNDVAISDRLLQHRQSETGQPFTLFVADECHKIKGNGDWTSRIRQIIHQTPDLYSHGNVLLMSGTPATNTLADLRVTAELLEPQGASQTSRGRRQRDRTLHPAFMRNMLERLVVLDPPGDWQRYVMPFPYDLGRADQRLVEAVANDNTRTAKNKIDTSLRIIRSTDNMFGYTTAQLEEYLNQRNTVLIAENIHAQGVTRDWDTPTDGGQQNGNSNQHTDPVFRDRIARYLNDWSRQHNIPVNFHVIDGETNRTPRQREVVFSMAAESDRSGTSKTVILVHSSCINEGIDLRFIRRMIALEWPWNSPELQQLLQRSLRAGNTDIFMTAFYAQDTLEHGIYDVAEDKYTDVRAAIYGPGLSDRQLRRAGQDDSDIARTLRLLERLQSPEQREDLIQRLLHGKGMKRYQKFWERPRYKRFFLEHLESAEEAGIGDAERYVGSLIADLESANVLAGGQYLHVHARGLSLERSLHRIQPRDDRQVISMDPIEYMLEEGHAALRRQGCRQTPRILRGSFTHLLRFQHRKLLPKGGLDAVILEGIEHARNVIPSRGRQQYSERLRALVGAVRALETHGKLIIAVPRGACTQQEFTRFCEKVLPHLGCVVLSSWTGEGRSTDNESDPAFRMFSAVATKVKDVDRSEYQNIDPTAMQLTHWSQWGETRERTRFENDRKKRKLPYQLAHTQFQNGRHAFGTGQPSEAHARQVVYMRAIQESVQSILFFAPTIADFIALPPTDRDRLLMDIHATYLPRLSPSKRRPAFQLTAYPDYFFYPYDPQWKVE